MNSDELTGFDAWFGTDRWNTNILDGMIDALTELEKAIHQHTINEARLMALDLDAKITGAGQDDDELQ